MNLNSLQWFDWLRCCARCGRTNGRVDLYCSMCWIEILSRCNDVLSQNGYEFPVHSLFTWRNEEPFTRDLIYDLKGGQMMSAWQRLSVEFSFRRCMREHLAEGNIAFFVVPPRLKGVRVDHAMRFAQSLSEIWSRPVFDPFVWAEADSGEAQKRKSEAERETRAVAWAGRTPEHWLSPRKKRVIFVDDVITTGATARAIWRGLHEPCNFEVWTLACRPKLASF